MLIYALYIYVYCIIRQMHNAVMYVMIFCVDEEDN